MYNILDLLSKIVCLLSKVSLIYALYSINSTVVIIFDRSIPDAE
jgi:hypothetical protein